MELLRVESAPRIVRLHRIHVPEEYYWFSATRGSDTLVAMSYYNSVQNSVLMKIIKFIPIVIICKF